MSPPPEHQNGTEADDILGTEDSSLLDVVDNVLSKGVVLTGDLTVSLAHVDLIYARLSLLLCAADQVLPNEDDDVLARHSRRHALRVRRSTLQPAQGRPERSRGTTGARGSVSNVERRRKSGA